MTITGSIMGAGDSGLDAVVSVLVCVGLAVGVDDGAESASGAEHLRTPSRVGF